MFVQSLLASLTDLWSVVWWWALVWWPCLRPCLVRSVPSCFTPCPRSVFARPFLQVASTTLGLHIVPYVTLSLSASTAARDQLKLVWDRTNGFKESILNFYYIRFVKLYLRPKKLLRKLLACCYWIRFCLAPPIPIPERIPFSSTHLHIQRHAQVPPLVQHSA